MAKKTAAKAKPKKKTTVAKTVAAEAPPPGAAAMLDLAALHPSALNPRKTFDHSALADLAESIATQGILQNLVVRRRDRGGFEIIAGERRWRAVAMLAEEGRWDRRAALIPVRIVEGDDAAVLAIALLENLQRQDVPPMEEAEAFAALHALDKDAWSTAAIAKRIGKTQRYVQQRLALIQKLDDKVKEALRAGEIDLTHARALTVADPKVQRDALDKIKAGYGGYVDAERLSDSMLGKLPLVSKAPFPVERYTGEIVEGPKPYGARDGRRFLDVEQFKALQKEVVDEKRAKLAGKWAWVEVKKGHSYRAEPNYGDYRKSSDKAKAGAVIFVEPDGGVIVKTGLVKVEKATRSDESFDQRYKREQAERQARRDAEQRFVLALGERLAGEPALAFQLLLAHLLGAELLDDGMGGVSVGPSPLTRAFRPALDGLLQDDDPAGNCRLREHVDPNAVFAALARLDSDTSARLLAALVAEHLCIAYDGLSPLLASTASVLGIELPEHLRGDEDEPDLADEQAVDPSADAQEAAQ